MSLPWSALGEALPYGYSIHWWLRVEGIPTLLCEVAGDAIAPVGYDIDPSLVIDDSARTGSVISDTTGIGAGFDLEVRLLDTEVSRLYFTTPARQATLVAALTAAATTLDLGPGHGWPSSGRAWVDLECIPYAATTWSELTSGTRGTYARARDWPAGTIVADAPRAWLDRRVDLFAVLMDPTGRYVQQGNVLSDASCVFTGFIATAPERTGSEWSFQARPIDRRLAQSFAAAAEGQALWTLNGDGPIEIDPNAAMYVRVTERPAFGSNTATTTIEDLYIAPFAGQTSPMRPSEIRRLVSAAWDAATTHAQLGGLIWKEEMVSESNATLRRWRAYAQAKVSGDDLRIWFELVFYAAWGKPFRYERESPNHAGSQLNMPRTSDGGSGWGEVWLPLSFRSSVGGGALSVVLEEGDPATLPATGYVALEADGKSQVSKYTSRTVDDVDSSKVHLILEHDLDIQALNRLAQQDADGSNVEVSARFLYSDAGKAQDIMRRLLVSQKGDGSGGVYDTLPPLAAYGLGNLVDTASFTTVFDGLFQSFGLDVAIDFGLSFEKIFAGILRLSRRSVVSRPAADGSAVRLTAVHAGLPTSAIVSAVIDDRVIAAATDGIDPIRPKPRASPRTISLATHLLDEAAARGRVTFNNRSGNEVSVEAWDLDVYGIARSVLRVLGEPWAEAIFRAAWTTQPIEVDVMPTVQAYAGDLVWFETSDPHVWSYSTGRPGYAGLARVKGNQLGLKNQLQTVHLEIDGLYSLKPMSPSIAISAVNGTATAPSSIDVAQEHLALFESLIEAVASFQLLAYKPGEDGGRALYTISAVADTGTHCRLTVSAAASSPTVTLTTSFRVTYPTEQAGNAAQAAYLHTSSRAQWG